MTQYQWNHNTPLVRANVGERIEDGDVFEPTDGELKAFKDRLEAVEESEPEAFTCVGNDGECSRSVDSEGGRCWQHSSDE